MSRWPLAPHPGKGQASGRLPVEVCTGAQATLWPPWGARLPKLGGSAWGARARTTRGQAPPNQERMRVGLCAQRRGAEDLRDP